MHLRVSLQYRLRMDFVGKLYNKHNINYDDVIASTVRKTLIDAASEFTASQLWEERRDFQSEMHRLVNKSLWDQLWTECWGLQLLEVQLPNDYEERITMTQIKKQLQHTNEMDQQTQTIDAETGAIQSNYSRQVKVAMAKGHAAYAVTTKDAEAQARQQRIQNESQALRSVAWKLAFTGQDLVTYQRYTMLEDLEQSRVYYGFVGASSMMVQA
mmetsp:Transcript_62990/g.121376  ORF Transcript_62990/g.121376 Transcript_62990/m.121376 type:complete len:213 (-) Transcript_62990:28-666(-)